MIKPRTKQTSTLLGPFFLDNVSCQKERYDFLGGTLVFCLCICICLVVDNMSYQEEMIQPWMSCTLVFCICICICLVVYAWLWLPGRKDTTLDELHFSPRSSCQTCYVMSEMRDMFYGFLLFIGHDFCHHHNHCRRHLRRHHLHRHHLRHQYLGRHQHIHLTLHSPARGILTWRSQHKVKTTLLKCQSNSCVSFEIQLRNTFRKYS